MWCRYLNQGLPPEAVDTLTCSLSKSTQRQYASTYRQWSTYCTLVSHNPFDVSPIQVISFLQKLLDEKKLTYQSLGAHRSALSFISAHNLGENDLVSRFMKGVFHRKPPQPKYVYTWDPKPVLLHLKSIQPDSLLPFSKKLLTLMLLASGQRLQTMAAIEIPDIHFTTSGVSIWITKILKTTRPGSKGVNLVFPLFTQQPSLCIPTNLQAFLRLTESLRPEGVKALFIISSAVHTPAQVPTLARWTKDILDQAGIDTSLFSSHSTRHASVSAAARAGTNLNQIFKAAGWTENSGMFARVYNRPIENPSAFSQAVYSVLDE